MTVKEFFRYEETIKINRHIIIRDIRRPGYCLYDGAYSHMPNTIFALRACKVIYYQDAIIMYVDEEISCIADEAFDDLLISLIYKLYDERIKRADITPFGYRVIMKDGSKYYIDREFLVDELTSSIGIMT